MSEKGVIKFNCNWIKEKPVKLELFEQLNEWRNRLFSLGLIGVTQDGIGYGNISNRFFQNQFIITGSATGKIKKLTNKHYTKVIGYNIDNNSLTAQGPVIASSESLTHAALYELDSNIKTVFHIHHNGLWKQLKFKVPTSDISVEYGTPEMAKEMKHLYFETELNKKKILVMGGHQDGIITFGNTLNEAGQILLDHFNAYNLNKKSS
jgi:L-ribulose-5-phosphate 4-epimerase